MHLNLFIDSYFFSLLFFLQIENLTVLKFDYYKHLTRIHDISNLPNLEKLSFKWCESLVSVHNSVGFLTNSKY